jgi:hypothetical protein
MTGEVPAFKNARHMHIVSEEYWSHSTARGEIVTLNAS